MRGQWYRVKKTYDKPQGGFLAIGPRYPGVLSDDGLVVLFTHPGQREVRPTHRALRSRRRKGVGGTVEHQEGCLTWSINAMRGTRGS